MFKFGFNKLLLEGEPDSALAGGGAETPPVDTPPVETPPAESIYGDLQVKFPEGFDDGLRNEPMFKAFVNKETGEFNYANLMKSYAHAQKQMGSDKVALPNKYATPEELDNFYARLGYEPDAEKYTIERPEGAKISEDRFNEIKNFAREHRLPVKTAQALYEKLEAQEAASMDSSVQSTVAQIKEGLDSLQAEWGQAYQPKLQVAQRVLKDVINDESILEQFKDPRIGSNPAVIKALASIGEKLFKEDGFKGDSGNMAMTPQEASEAINEMMGNRQSPYWDANHPAHNDYVNKMLKLREMASGRA